MSNDIKQFNDIVESTIKGKWKNAAKMCYECKFDAAHLIHFNEIVKDCEVGYEEDDEYIISNYWRNKYHVALLIEMKYEYEKKLKEEQLKERIDKETQQDNYPKKKVTNNEKQVINWDNVNDLQKFGIGVTVIIALYGVFNLLKYFINNF